MFRKQGELHLDRTWRNMCERWVEKGESVCIIKKKKSIHKTLWEEVFRVLRERRGNDVFRVELRGS